MVDRQQVAAGGVRSLVLRALRIEATEAQPLFWAGAFFFCLMSSYYILRPVRDAMGLAGGVRNLQWLFTGTLVAMLFANPLFAALVGALPRRRFIPIVYRFFMLNLLLFFVLMHTPTGAPKVWLARGFYVWVSVFALFVVSVFWGLMADLFRSKVAKRVFGLIGLGGTLGAMAGAGVTSLLAETLGPAKLLPVSIVLLEGAVFCTRRLFRLAQSRADPFGAATPESVSPAESPTAGRSGRVRALLGGIELILRSPYLLGICLYMFFYTTTSTVLYFAMATLIDAHFGNDVAATTALFARMDLVTNALALVIQAFLTSRIVARWGLALTLVLLPALTAAGLSILAVAPLLGVVVVFNVLRRTTQFAIGKPAREVLYTPLTPEAKYKAKSLIDTFIYRGGDALAAWAFEGLRLLELGLAPIAWLTVPLALAWAGLGAGLGLQQRRLATAATRVNPFASALGTRTPNA